MASFVVVCPASAAYTSAEIIDLYEYRASIINYAKTIGLINIDQKKNWFYLYPNTKI